MMGVRFNMLDIMCGGGSGGAPEQSAPCSIKVFSSQV